MIANIQYNSTTYKIDFSSPLDISLPLTNTPQNPIAWYLDQPVIEPVKMGEWIGRVKYGSSTNFNNIAFNPHGHGTHTECLGHITHEFYSINQCLKQFFFFAQVVTITPEIHGEDAIITKKQLQDLVRKPQALIIRTLPNDELKRHWNYSNTNPPYLAEDAATFIRECGTEHLLIDLPSVDREKDEGQLLAHKAFWNVKNIVQVNSDARINATITEMIFVDNSIADGDYFLNIQIASFENDASPSKPFLYKILD